MSDDKPTIDVPENGPFLVKGLGKLTDAQNHPIEMAKDVIALCRCGASKNKPFCDGTHKEIGFTGARERQQEYPVREYAGEELTVVDDIGVCCHAGACVKGAPETFFKWEGDERVSQPDEGEREKVIATIRACPSGSLAYKLDGKTHDEFFSEPEIFVSADGPLHVRGGVVMNEHTPATTDHYTLCRCGASKNKPYCDGAHKEAGFKG
ncbi:MAG: CDGSH iron-sulfur domain-containing protein [bacterium]|nr:CDGSH iron-sulfur domain-containing protein [bacterium]